MGVYAQQGWGRRGGSSGGITERQVCVCVSFQALKTNNVHVGARSEMPDKQPRSPWSQNFGGRLISRGTEEGMRCHAAHRGRQHFAPPRCLASNLRAAHAVAAPTTEVNHARGGEAAPGVPMAEAWRVVGRCVGAGR